MLFLPHANGVSNPLPFLSTSPVFLFFFPQIMFSSRWLFGRFWTFLLFVLMDRFCQMFKQNQTQNLTHILFEICKCHLPRRSLTSHSCITAMLSPPNAGLQTPIGSVGTGQQTAPTLPSSTPFDPSSMKRAYDALGLPYSNQTPTQTQSPAQTQGPGQPTAQTQHQQQMRPINALGKNLI